jgi:8-oxo-dGTP diphosphatase
MLELRVDLVVLSLHETHLYVLLEQTRSGSTWSLPGCPVGEARSLTEEAQGCLSGAIGRGDAYLEQLYTYGDPGRVPGGRSVSCVYLGLLRSATPQTPSAGHYAWHDAARPPALLFDHRAILEYALTRLRYKLEYTAVGFQLLPETFTLTELQRAYEAVLGEALDKRNFRRRILAAGVIEPTRGYRSGEGRPARLYRYRDDAVAEVKARRLFP